MAASLFWTIHHERPTVLLDEAQNSEVADALKSIINGGFDKSLGGIPRRNGGGTITYNVYGPLAFCWNKGSEAATLPLDTRSRCIVLDFDRGKAKRRYNMDDAEQQQEFAALRDRIMKWAMTVTLDGDPAMPSELGDGRIADCWRPLLSIADSLERGDVARQAGIALSKRRMDESIRVRLLRDTRVVFDRFGCDNDDNNADTIVEKIRQCVPDIDDSVLQAVRQANSHNIDDVLLGLQRQRDEVSRPDRSEEENEFQAAFSGVSIGYLDALILGLQQKQQQQLKKQVGCTVIKPDDLLKGLRALEDCSLEDGATWNYWTGVNGKQSPHALKKPEMMTLLRTFPIQARTVWPEPRRSDSKSFNGYKREWFEPFWAQYCPDDDTPPTISQGQALTSRQGLTHTEHTP